MKKVIVTGTLLLAAIGMIAQPQDSTALEIDIRENEVRIAAEDLKMLSELDLNSILKEVSAKSELIQKQQQELLSRVDEQERNGEITEEQADEMREMIRERTAENMEAVGEIMEIWGDAYEEKWEAWADQYERSLDLWADEMERRAEAQEQNSPPPGLPLMPEIPAPMQDREKSDSTKDQRIIISDEGITIDPGEPGEEPFAWKFRKRDHDGDDNMDRDRRRIDRTETYFDIHFGFNQLLDEGQFVITDEPSELDPWKSTQFEIGLGGKTRLGSPYSKFYLKWGGEFSWHNFRLQGDNVINKTPNGIQFQPDTNNITKSKFEIAYFNIPLMLQMDLSDVGDMDEAFTLGVGGYGGIRLRSTRKLEYTDFDDAEVEERFRNDFFTNRLRYGVMFQLGWKSLKLTAKYDLNTYFQEDKGPEYQLASVNIGFTL